MGGLEIATTSSQPQNTRKRNRMRQPTCFTRRLPLIFVAFTFLFSTQSVLILAEQSIPLVAECEKGSSPVFLLQHNSTNGVQIRPLPASNFLECSEYCSNANDCVGVEYADGQCRILGASASAYEQGNGQVITKSCVKSERICASPFHFDVHEQKILVGFAREVVPADTIQVCLSACLNAFDTFGFECESVMYYPVDRECILNTEDRLDRPDLFVDEHEDQVIYLDNNCAGSQCYAPYVTQYVAVEGKQLQEELDHKFADIDWASCEELCTQRLTTTVNDFNCKSFMYDNQTRTCILSDERSKPLGRGNLTQAEGYTYYEKKCFASPRTCRNVPSFTRVPQMLLVGFAAFVMENVPSVTMCLDQCTNPPPETGDKFVCKSAMYYYNEQECILNAESRHSKPDLFIPEEDDFVVDYFDINCHLEAETCPEGKQLATVKTLNAALPEGDGSLHVIESAGNTVADCMSKCFSMAPEKCRSFNFDKSGNICNLLYLDGKTTLRPQVKQGTDLYDLHCLKGTSNCLNKDGAMFSRYLYTKQPGLPHAEHKTVALSKCLDLCSSAERCEGVNYNRRNGNCALFQQIEINGESAGEKHDHIDFYTNLCQVKEVDTGVSSAINVPKEPVHVKSETNTTHTIDKQPTKERTKDDRVDVLNKPETKITKPTIKEQSVRFAPEPNPDAAVDKNAVGDGKASGSLTVSNTGNAAGPAAPVLIPPSAVHTICNYEGIKVQIKNSEPFTGVVFVKNKYDTCRVEVGSEGHEAQLSANEIRRRRQTERDCGLIDMDNGTYKTTVVVQTNNLGIPGLVTSMDQIYEIACNYSSMLGGKVTAAANMTVHGPQPSLIQPRGKIELGNPVLMQMNAGNGEHHPVIQAKLGDILELRWEIMAMDEELDFFVKDCFAEPGVTNASRTDEKLQLIEAGCPTPAVSQKLIPNPIQVQSSAVKIAHLQAFRFDSSSTVRITCHLEICKGDCKSASCNLQGAQKESWGRKKRESENSVTEFETKRYKVPRFAQATTSLVIIDPLQQMNEGPSSASKHSAQDFSPNQPKHHGYGGVEKTAIEHSSVWPARNGQSEMCMNKWTLMGVLGTLFVLILVQAIIVTKYIFKRIFVQSIAKKAATPFHY
ncbi:PAN domain-containing protein [Ditylenchus destructor]|uniref:PAN domain-containing protein n=1 Tax=Ditylenchus destructor TaxID=166010 RepID=A0AAD4MZ10_9BILA|nr:PAN domain-containing protein [Ditylenchus destructor]